MRSVMALMATTCPRLRGFAAALAGGRGGSKGGCVLVKLGGVFKGFFVAKMGEKGVEVELAVFWGS